MLAYKSMDFESEFSTEVTNRQRRESIISEMS